MYYKLFRQPIGRRRFIAWMGVFILLYLLPMFIITTFNDTAAKLISGETAAAVVGLNSIIFIIVVLILSGRRLADINRSQAWALLIGVPLLNLLLLLWLAIAAGNQPKQEELS